MFDKIKACSNEDKAILTCFSIMYFLFIYPSGGFKLNIYLLGAMACYIVILLLFYRNIGRVIDKKIIDKKVQKRNDILYLIFLDCLFLYSTYRGTSFQVGLWTLINIITVIALSWIYIKIKSKEWN